MAGVQARPPLHSNVQGGRMRIPIFLGKGVFFCFCLGKISPSLNQSPEIWGVFQKLPEKLRKRGYNYLYVHVTRAFNSLPRKEDKALMTLHNICGRAPRVYSDKICTHIYFPSPKENKRKGIGVTIMFRDRGSFRRSSLKRGWILCGKPVRHRGYP